MGFILGILAVIFVYVCEGILISYIDFKQKNIPDLGFELNWREILSWAKLLF